MTEPLAHDDTGKMSGSGNATFAVIFTSQRTSSCDPDYESMAERMISLASKQPGFIGVTSARNSDGSGITVSLWKSLEAIKLWKANEEHLAAQKSGKEKWYSSYNVKVCRIAHEYGFDKMPEKRTP